MDYDDLLEKKKEVDELGLYYQILKDKVEEIDAKFYDNNVTDLVNVTSEEKNELIEKKIKDGNSRNTINKLAGYWLRYVLLLIVNGALEMPGYIFSLALFINLSYYCYNILCYDSIARKKIEKEMENTVEVDTLLNEKKELDKRLEFVRSKYYKAACEYSEMCSELQSFEYQKYLEYISGYLQYMLEHSKEVLEEASKDYKHLSFEEEYKEYCEELSEEDDYPYALK